MTTLSGQIVTPGRPNGAFRPALETTAANDRGTVRRGQLSGTIEADLVARREIDRDGEHLGGNPVLVAEQVGVRGGQR